MKRIKAGTIISEGTVRVEDLTERYLAVIHEYRPLRAAELTQDGFESDDGDFLNTLCEELEDIAAEHEVWFGAAEGDGACFGFWEFEDRGYWLESMEDQIADTDDGFWNPIADLGRAISYEQEQVELLRDALRRFPSSDRAAQALADLLSHLLPSETK